MPKLIGNAPNQVPTNADLGSMAFEDKINYLKKFTAGTVSLPSITTTGDTNTGIFFPAADTIAFTEGGAEAMRIDSSGNVGIGKSALPGIKLDINGPVNMVDNAWFQFGSKNTLFSSAAVAGLIIQSPTAGSENIIFRTSTGAERMRINNSNYVGIGTPSPDALLSVNGVASFGDGTALLPSIANFGDLNTGMWFPAADTIAFSKAGTEAMRILDNGNVAIGRTTANFSGLGTDHTVLSVGAFTFNMGMLELAGWRSVDGDLGRITFGNKNVRLSEIVAIRTGADNASALSFSTSSSGSNTERMRIDSSGNVGINTTTPSTKLTINQSGEPPAEGMLLLQANSSSRQLRIQPPTNTDNGFIDYRGGNLTFLDDGTEVARFQGSTGFEVTGTIKVSDGIYLGGTGTANKLDDYEEGTFTPAITVGSGSVTHVTQTGNYTKVGRLVYFDIRVTLSAISSPSGTLFITGLPFAGGISGRSGLVKFTSVNNFSSIIPADVLSSYISTGTSVLVTNNAGVGYNASNLEYNTQFDLSGMYQTN